MRTKRTLITAAVLVALARAGDASAGSHSIVKVSTGGRAITEVPVSVSLPAADSKSVVVTSLATRCVVPSQVERVGDKLLETWMVRQPRGGKDQQFRIEFSDRPARPDPRGVRLRKRDEAVDVTINGTLFTRYVFTAFRRPYCYPVIGPFGKPITRGYPIRDDIEGESNDHPNHQSFWFTFGDVNKVDFWGEEPQTGRIMHREFEALESGPVYGRICSRNDWIAPDGGRVCEDRRNLRIYRTRNGRLMDFEVTVYATDGPVTFGDTKEGMTAFRVASSMEVDRGKGHLENSRGQKDGDTWGKRAEWCDYYGPVDDQVVGIAIMDHPSNFRHPTYWMARTYGLFAVNPFGVRAYTGDKNADGSYTIQAGGEMTFRYRIFIHKGSAQEAKVAEVYAAYADPPGVAAD